MPLDSHTERIITKAHLPYPLRPVAAFTPAIANTYEISALCGVLHVVLYLARVALLLLLPLFAAKFTSTSSEDTVTLFTAAKNVTLAAGEY
ncbi:hypothetical protein E8E15_010628 [Penicillium rubens]|nr:hypothetical protein E8E15_010628 [Penicillium rubens]